MRSTATPRPGQVRQRGCGGAWVPARKGRLWGGSRDPRARPAHRGRSGLRPGAFRAQAATRLGKSRPPSGRRGLAGQSGGGDSRNLPGDRRRVTGQNRPIYGQRFRCVSGESPGARQWTGLRLRTARLAPGILPPGPGRLGPVRALDFPAPGIRVREEGWTHGLGLRNAWAELEKGHKYRSEPKQQWGVGSSTLSSLRPPGFEKRDNRN